MALTLKPFTMKDVSLTLVKTADAATATPEEYKCQLSRAELVPAAGNTTGNELETFCEKHTDAGSSLSTWTLELAGFQAWQDVLDFSRISFNDEGVDYNFELVPHGAAAAPGPAPSPTAPSFTGTVKMVATAVGGSAATMAQFTASLPCQSKPVMNLV